MEDWRSAQALAPEIALFSWGPGDSLVVTSGRGGAAGAHAAQGGDSVPGMPGGGGELSEFRLHKPWALWRHRRYVQRPFQLFFAEAHNVWSERIRETIEISMDESCVEERRALLCDETLQYKELYGRLMARVFEYPDTELHDERENWRQLGRQLYRGHQAWHLAHVIISHLSRPVPTHPSAPHYDLPFDLVHWLQEHTPADVFNDSDSRPFLGNGAVNEEWWGALCNFVMHLYIDQAVSMLDDLKRMPACGQDGHDMVEEIKLLLLELKDMEDMVDQNRDIKHHWRQWQRQHRWITLDNLILAKNSPICAQVGSLKGILTGQESAIGERARGWSQNVVARMMFARSEAVLGVADLANYTEDALSQHGAPEDEEAVLADLMRLEMQGAVQRFFTHLHDWWSAAHLADVLYRGNYLPFSLQFAADMRSFALRNYIDICLASNNMWEVAISYCKGLVDCDVATDTGAPREGLSRYQQRRDEMVHYAHYIVSRQSVQSDRACRRLLASCPEYLTSLRSSDGHAEGYPLFTNAEIRRGGGDILSEHDDALVYRQLAARGIQAAWGMSLYSKEHAGAALYWLSEARSDLVPQLARRTLQRLVKGDNVACMSGSGGARGHDEDLESLLHYVEEKGNVDDWCEIPEVALMRDYLRLDKLLKFVHAARHDSNQSQQEKSMVAKVEAAELLRQLLQTSLGGRQTGGQAGMHGTAPRALRYKMLLLTVDLLEAEGPLVFSSNDIFAFMQALQDTELSYKTPPASKDSSSDVHKVRLALSRGLAKALQCGPGAQ